jgi:hypothetical protein
MPTILQPRWLLLKVMAMDSIDSASTYADAIGATVDRDKGDLINIHLGKAESAIEWMGELLAHYKQTLDTVAVALIQTGKDIQADPNVTAALEALYEVQSDYMDGLALGDSDRPGE